MPDVPTNGFSKLETQDLIAGKGDPIKKGDNAVVFYVGKLTNGTIFDSNMEDDGKYTPKEDKDPFSFTVGIGSVIKGWDEGLVGAKEGTVRKINIPWTMAYGAEGSGNKIPPKSDLIFTVKVYKVYHQGVAPEIDATDVKVGSGPKVTKDSVITFTYVGKLLAGKVFDDQSKKPITQPVGKLIPGFRDAVLGMMPGGQRKISWPPGSPNPTGQIPVNQPVEFIVDLKSVK